MLFEFDMLELLGELGELGMTVAAAVAL